MKHGKSAQTLDLHGLTAAQAIDLFIQCYNERAKRGQFTCWTVVHGYGSSGEGGVIRSRVRALLARHPDRLRFEPGENYGNPGWTWVYPKLPLPDRQEALSLDIMAFCTEPKIQAKIVMKFASHGEVHVKETVQSLAKQARLRIVSKGGLTAYQTASSG